MMKIALSLLMAKGHFLSADVMTAGMVDEG